MEKGQARPELPWEPLKHCGMGGGCFGLILSAMMACSKEVLLSKLPLLL